MIDHSRAPLRAASRIRARRCEGGSSSGETLIGLAMAALAFTLVAVAFSRSTAYGFAVLAIGAGTAMLVFVYAVVREWRRAHQSETRIRSAMDRAAAERQGMIEATFFGEAQGGTAAFGVAGTARKLVYARGGFQKVSVTVLDFGQLAAAFTRPDRDRFRLEIRTQASAGGSPREAFYLLVAKRADAERWVEVLAPHLGDRAKLLEQPEAAQR